MFLEERLDQILEKQQKLEEMLQLFIPDLTKKKSVEHFLQISRQTMATYLNDGVLKKDVHYYLDDKGAQVFIPNAIIEFKKSGGKAKARKTRMGKKMEVLEQMGVCV